MSTCQHFPQKPSKCEKLARKQFLQNGQKTGNLPAPPLPRTRRRRVSRPAAPTPRTNLASLPLEADFPRIAGEECPGWLLVCACRSFVSHPLRMSLCSILPSEQKNGADKRGAVSRRAKRWIFAAGEKTDEVDAKRLAKSLKDNAVCGRLHLISQPDG